MGGRCRSTRSGRATATGSWPWAGPPACTRRASPWCSWRAASRSTCTSTRPRWSAALREWGCEGPPEPDRAPSLAIEDDPCARRAHARKVLQRLLRMGKVGEQHHTEFDHLYRGAAADDRRDALEVGEALLKAGLLGEKPSVGQRHVYLRRERLPEIHALIERGATRDETLAAHWTAPPPGA